MGWNRIRRCIHDGVHWWGGCFGNNNAMGFFALSPPVVGNNDDGLAESGGSRQTTRAKVTSVTPQSLAGSRPGGTPTAVCSNLRCHWDS
jgi:hypothetical protein